MGAIQSSNGVKFRERREGTGLNGYLLSNVFIYPKFAQQNRGAQQKLTHYGFVHTYMTDLLGIKKFSQ